MPPTLKSSTTALRGPDHPDVAAAQALLTWARREKWAFNRLRVGDVELEIAADLSLAVVTPPSLKDSAPSQDPYEQFGGPALKRLREQEQAEQSAGDATVTEDEDG